jgi:rhamnose utilization protein RhaD (predicted bifunctional aldolase and dehydrogenase)/NAD(P)-dependent dehydrogenase (short-subunit alcohol dehydrogenase family)
MTMGTAATMMGLAEAIGMTLPGASSIPAADAGHIRMSAACGRRIVDMVWEDLRPQRVLSRASFANGIATAMAMGCSTNAIIHLVAISRRAGHPVTLDDFDAASRRVPVIANIRPSGDRYLMEDFFYAGGLRALLEGMGPHLDRSALTVNGRSIGDNVAGAEVFNDDVIRPLDRPIYAEGALAVLRGNIAPDGVIIKPSACAPHLLRHTGRALVFDDYPSLKKAVDDPDLDVTGDDVLVLPWIMPGFPLAKAVAAAHAARPDVRGIVLAKHGLFTFGATARESYERTIEIVDRAERYLRRQLGGTPAMLLGDPAPQPAGERRAFLQQVLPIVRGALAQSVDSPLGAVWQRVVADARATDQAASFSAHAMARELCHSNPITPDHVIRTKGKPMLVPAPAAGDFAGFAAAVRQARADYDSEYRAYFERHNARVGGIKKILDTSPRVVLVPGIGAFCAGITAKDARIAGDLVENAATSIADAEALGPFESVSEADLFDVEYWSLEQAKLGKSAEKRLQRHVALVTGGGSGIGAASVAAFAAEGCEVVVLDRDGASAQAIARKYGGLGLACDVTQGSDVRAAFDAAATRFGGVDIVVSNAGAAWQGKIGEVDDKTLRDSFELNFFAHQNVAQSAVRAMKAQGTGGCLLFNVSKQAVNPGPDFGPYGLPKAATLVLLRQYAVDYGALGIRANGINADRIRTGLLTDAMIASRSKARGLTERDYMGGNLLGREVTAGDVAQGFVSLALARATTGAILTVDGGNIAAALR